MFLLLAVGLTWFKPWYVAWLLAMAPLTLDGRREMRAALFSLTAFLSYTILDYVWPLNGALFTPVTLEATLVGTVFLPVLLFMAVTHWPRWRRREAWLKKSITPFKP